MRFGPQGSTPAPECETPWSVESTEDNYLRNHRSHDVGRILKRWRAVAREAGLQVATLIDEADDPVIALRNRKPVTGPGLYLSAGIHGDEPAAVWGLLEWAEENTDMLQSQSVVIFPCVNPWGLVNNKREDQEGRDLNRAFDQPEAGPIGAMLEFIRGREFAVAVSLHEDYDANGAYVYELTRRGESWGDYLLEEVEQELPRHQGSVEGRRSKNGVLRRTQGFAKIAGQIAGMPESICLYLGHARIALTFETPSEFSLYRRVRAHVRLLDGVLRRMGQEGK